MPTCRGAKGCGSEFDIEDESQLTMKGKAFGYPCPYCGHLVNLKNDEVKEALNLDDEQAKELKKELTREKRAKKASSSESPSVLDIVQVPEGINPNMEDIDLYKVYGQTGLNFAKKKLLVEHLLSLKLDEKTVKTILYWWDRRESYRKRPGDLTELLKKVLGNKFAKNMIDDIVDDVFGRELEIIEQVNRERDERSKYLDLEVRLAKARGEHVDDRSIRSESGGSEEPAREEPSREESPDTGDIEKDVGRKLLEKMSDQFIDNMFPGSGSGGSSGGSSSGGGSNAGNAMGFYASMLGSATTVVTEIVGPVVSGLISTMESQQRLFNAQIMREMGLDPTLAFEIPSSGEKTAIGKQQIINWIKRNQGSQEEQQGSSEGSGKGTGLRDKLYKK